eukprot:scaffold40377_cov168-Amphora_coffeaeformis.AAC.7
MDLSRKEPHFTKKPSSLRSMWESTAISRTIKMCGNFVPAGTATTSGGRAKQSFSGLSFVQRDCVGIKISEEKQRVV